MICLVFFLKKLHYSIYLLETPNFGIKNVMTELFAYVSLKRRNSKSGNRLVFFAFKEKIITVRIMKTLGLG
jgi:hypothetical protein